MLDSESQMGMSSNGLQRDIESSQARIDLLPEVKGWRAGEGKTVFDKHIEDGRVRSFKVNPESQREEYDCKDSPKQLRSYFVINYIKCCKLMRVYPNIPISAPITPSLLFPSSYPPQHPSQSAYP